MSLFQVVGIFACLGVVTFANPININDHEDFSDINIADDNWMAGNISEQPDDDQMTPYEDTADNISRTDNMTTTPDNITSMLDELEKKLSSATQPSSTTKDGLTKRIQYIDSRLRHLEKIVSYRQRLSPDDVMKMVVQDDDFTNFPAFPTFANGSKTEK